MFRILAVLITMAGASGAFAAGLTDGLPEPYQAPAIGGISAWINSEPLTKKDLKGKVVLVDFWAYSCVNCVRTLPYINEWDKKYRDKGLVIIGVHAPEFDFEKDVENVKRAVKKWHVTYPVALDNDQVTWNNFSNRYWPAHYLISKQGKVVYTHFGEGKYDVTENNIRELLGISGEVESGAKQEQSHIDQTPETYLGYARMQHFVGEKPVHDQTTAYSFPDALPVHGWALEGKWNIGSEKITAAEKDAKLRLHFTSKKVFLVLGTKSGKPIEATLTLGGKPLDAQAGKDAPKGKLTVDSHTLYELVAQDSPATGVLEITTNDAGLEAYAFTFGK